jgi:fructose-specific phosphotransferase system IIC component
MSKTLRLAKLLNWVLIGILTISIAEFISFLNIYGLFLASVTSFIAFGVFKNNRWGYFSSAAWGFACYQLAKEGYEFQNIKHYVMTVGVIVIPLALFLHEILAKKNLTNAHKSVTTSTDDHEMPQ